jgi:hypothetical protein
VSFACIGFTVERLIPVFIHQYGGMLFTDLLSIQLETVLTHAGTCKSPKNVAGLANTNSTPTDLIGDMDGLLHRAKLDRPVHNINRMLN